MRYSEPRRVVAIPSDDVPAIPRGTLISCAEPLQPEPLIWITDSMAATFSDHQRVAVVPAPMDT
jgi:hypothetical protein